MRTLLICPSERSAVAGLSQRLPLVNVPLFGQSLLEYWISALALKGITEVVVLVHDRPELSKELVRKGERWGISVQVIAESRELTHAEALLKYAPSRDSIPSQDGIVVLDHFPGRPDRGLFNGYAQFFEAVREWMPAALTADRVGFNEVRPGIWVGCRSHVSAQAQLKAPCWVGQHVWIGPGALIGPGAIVEDGSLIEPGAELRESWIGPDTFVGQFARISHSMAWASTLVNWQTGSAAQVADPFILCAIREPRRAPSEGWLSRLAELYDRNKGEAGLLWKHLLLHRES